MPRLGNSSTNTTAINVAKRTGQLRFYWSVSYEVDWRNHLQSALIESPTVRGRAYIDDLSVTLDKVLAYAG